MPLTSKPLAPDTWSAFARLVEKHDGIFGGCRCISFHLEPGEKRHGYAAYKEMKRALVRQGRAHAALVFTAPKPWDGASSAPPPSFPTSGARKPTKRTWASSRTGASPASLSIEDDGGEGIASFALREALREMTRLGGGTVGAYPEDYTGERVSSSFLCSGTLGMFEKAGFKKARKIAMHRWVVVKQLTSKHASQVAN
jgi:hypothetical protein